MSHKTASKHKKNSNQPLNGGETLPTSALTLPKQVELRAYELYELRSHEDGSAEEDWLKAEQEVLRGRL
ncbi:MAG TPA: DUF2934 domain-containing protein [Terriglobales bacterium]